MSTPFLKAVLRGLHAVRADQLFARAASPARGVIFMLHHVLPHEPKAFSPNRILKVTPAFLEAVVKETRRAGFDCISLDEAEQRLTHSDGGRPFACFTFDDGYLDNATYAYPILKRHGVPFAVYVTPAFADGRADLWWLVLEEAIARSERVSVPLEAGERTYATATPRQKTVCFHEVYWALRYMPERCARAIVRSLAAQAAYDPNELARTLPMTWDDVRALNQDPLVTIGAHTMNHFALARLDQDEVRTEMEGSVARIEAELGAPCRHFSYPYGDALSAGPREFAIARELGLATAVTTQKGLVGLAGDAATRDPLALKRLSLNGDYQDMRYVRVLMSGLPFALMRATNRLRPVSRGARDTHVAARFTSRQL